MAAARLQNQWSINWQEVEEGQLRRHYTWWDILNSLVVWPFERIASGLQNVCLLGSVESLRIRNSSRQQDLKRAKQLWVLHIWGRRCSRVKDWYFGTKKGEIYWRPRKKPDELCCKMPSCEIAGESICWIWYVKSKQDWMERPAAQGDSFFWSSQQQHPIRHQQLCAESLCCRLTAWASPSHSSLWLASRVLENPDSSRLGQTSNFSDVINSLQKVPQIGSLCAEFFGWMELWFTGISRRNLQLCLWHFGIKVRFHAEWLQLWCKRESMWHDVTDVTAFEASYRAGVSQCARAISIKAWVTLSNSRICPMPWCNR